MEEKRSAPLCVDRPSNRLTRFILKIGDDHARALARQHFDRLRAYAACATSDKRHLSRNTADSWHY
jgi:hypothetical protein